MLHYLIAPLKNIDDDSTNIINDDKATLDINSSQKEDSKSSVKKVELVTNILNNQKTIRKTHEKMIKLKDQAEDKLPINN